MKKTSGTFTRRQMLGGLAVGAGSLVLTGVRAQQFKGGSESTANSDRLAMGEAFWRDVSSHYERADGIVNPSDG